MQTIRPLHIGRYLLGMTIAALLCGCSSSPSQQTHTLRVLSYNIHHGAGMDGKLDLERIAGVINSVSPDLVCLNEVDKGVERSRRIDEPARLGELTGMQPVFEQNIPFQGGQYGNAVLSRLPIRSWRNHHLPQSLPKEQRGMLEVHVNAFGVPLVFLATHFDYHPDDGERMASAEYAQRLIAELPSGPVILAGDLNATPESRVLEKMRSFLADCCCQGDDPGFTFPADKPDRRIDYIMHNRHPALRCLSVEVLSEAVASDHRPILATFELTVPAK